MSTTPPAWPGRDELVAKARRRWVIMIVTIAVVCAIAAPVGAALGLTSHRRSRTHHHTSTAVGIVIAVAVIALGVAVLIFVIRRAMRDEHGRWSPPISAGLPRRTRRAVGRNIRRGTPSADETLAQVEREAAMRLVSQFRFTMGVFALALVGETFEAVVHDSIAGRAFFAVASALFAGMLLYNVWFFRRTKAYLAITATSDPQ